MTITAWSLTDGTSAVSFYPSYKGYSQDEQKNTSIHKTPTARRFEYTWGNSLMWKLNIMFVNSSDAYNLNSWFKNSTVLELTPGYTTAVTTVSMTGKRPVRNPIDPYEDQFLAKVTLEELK